MEPVKGLHHVTAVTRDAQHNVDFYRNILGLRLVKKTVNFDAPEAYHLYFANEIGAPGAGSIHHIAFRVPTDEVQLEYQSVLRAAGYGVTPVHDRNYFHSIYYREPGGVLFEIATEPPGFAVDESIEVLGGSLQLPPWFESNQSAIEQDLPPVTLQPVEKVE